MKVASYVSELMFHVQHFSEHLLSHAVPCILLPMWSLSVLCCLSHLSRRHLRTGWVKLLLLSGNNSLCIFSFLLFISFSITENASMQCFCVYHLSPSLYTHQHLFTGYGGAFLAKGKWIPCSSEESKFIFPSGFRFNLKEKVARIFHLI